MMDKNLYVLGKDIVKMNIMQSRNIAIAHFTSKEYSIIYSMNQSTILYKTTCIRTS